MLGQTLDAYSNMGLTYTVYALRKKAISRLKKTMEQYTNTKVSISNNTINMTIVYFREESTVTPKSQTVLASKITVLLSASLYFSKRGRAY